MNLKTQVRRILEACQCVFKPFWLQLQTWDVAFSNIQVQKMVIVLLIGALAVFRGKQNSIRIQHRPASIVHESSSKKVTSHVNSGDQAFPFVQQSQHFSHCKISSIFLAIQEDGILRCGFSMFSMSRFLCGGVMVYCTLSYLDPTGRPLNKKRPMAVRLSDQASNSNL